MADRPGLLTIDDLRRELAEETSQLSDLDVMLADYHTERARLIRSIRRLKARLRDAEEQWPASPNRALDKPGP